MAPRTAAPGRDKCSRVDSNQGFSGVIGSTPTERSDSLVLDTVEAAVRIGSATVGVLTYLLRRASEIGSSNYCGHSALAAWISRCILTPVADHSTPLVLRSWTNASRLPTCGSALIAALVAAS